MSDTFCPSCSYCLPIGEGDHICSKYSVPILVLNNYEPTQYYNYCQQNKQNKKIMD